VGVVEQVFGLSTGGFDREGEIAHGSRREEAFFYEARGFQRLDDFV